MINMHSAITYYPIGSEFERLFRVVSLQGHEVEHLVDGVVSSHDAYEPDNPWMEVELLPGAAVVL